MVLVLSVVGLLFSQALAMLSVFFASEVMPTVLRLVCVYYFIFVSSYRSDSDPTLTPL